MKADIHPAYGETTVNCACGNTFTTRSTAKNGVIHAEVCARATRSTPASRRSSTPVAASPSGRSASARRPPTPPQTPVATRRRLAASRGRRPRSPVSGCALEPASAAEPEPGDPMFEPVEAWSPSTPSSSAQLADPAVHADQAAPAQLGRRYAELPPGRRDVPRVEAGRRRPRGGPRARRPTTRRSAPRPRRCSHEQAELAERLHVLLLPRDPMDDKDVILEIKAGEGGEESALFAGDLLRMYLRYAERRGWKAEILEAERVRPRRLQGHLRRREGQGLREPGEAPYARLKYEGGVHRVQRVPATESQGRIHTCAAGVLVLPGGRGRRGRDRPERPAHRRLPLERSRRPERQHHRLGRAHHPPADRHRGQLPEREEPAAEQGVGDAHPAGPAARRSPRRRRPRRRPTRAARRCARSTAASGSAPTTSPRTASATTAWASRRYNLDQVLDGELDGVVAGLRRRRPRRPPGRARRAERCPGRGPHRRSRTLRDVLVDAERRLARPASRPPASTPSCCWPTRWAYHADRTLPVRRRSPEQKRARSRSCSRAGSRGCRCSTCSARRLPAARARGRAAACSSRGRRPRAVAEAGDPRARRPTPRQRLAVDLCTGSGAVALSLAHRGAGSSIVHAVELSDAGVGWAAAQRRGPRRRGSRPSARRWSCTTATRRPRTSARSPAWPARSPSS